MELSYDAAHEGYREGKFSFLDMLDAQRGLFEAQGSLVDALEQYRNAVVAIETITGAPIEKITQKISEVE